MQKKSQGHSVESHDLQNSMDDILGSIRKIMEETPPDGHSTQEDISDTASRVLDHNATGAATEPASTIVSDTVRQETLHSLQDLRAPASSSTSSHTYDNPVETTALESVVIKALRPLLSEWLNQHLPSLVKNIVHAEIRKITRQL